MLTPFDRRPAIEPGGIFHIPQTLSAQTCADF
jgi:hypothetical protein